MASTRQLEPGSPVHIMGIGGYGMNPIARVMHQMGFAVSGCDMNESALIPALRELGMPVQIGHSAEHVGAIKPSALVISSAIPADNAEVAAARAAGIPVFKRADILCELMQGRTGIAIAGTHGKTTTTSMTAWALSECGADPSFIVGGVVSNLGTNARAGNGPAFVIEADEYDRMYLGLCPRIAVITSIEMDHPDMFNYFGEVLSLFTEFAAILPGDGLLIGCADDENVRELVSARREQSGEASAITYGIENGDWQAHGIRANEKGGVSFTATRGSEKVVEVALSLPGRHTVQNALAVIAICDAVGADLNTAAGALGRFGGAGRRFEVKGTAKGVTVIDDYAHHPTAIRTTLEAVKQRYPGQAVWAVWQPHTFSRTKALLHEFAASFEDADHVIITDVFRSRDKSDFGVSPQTVLDLMPGHPDARHISGLDNATQHIAENAQRGDVVIVMSAGDATRICGDLLELLGH